jgi:hypothetical protein
VKTAGALAAVAGLTTVLGGIGGLSWWSSRSVAAPATHDWRPRCAARLGWDTLEVETTTTSRDEPYTLFGLDMSPSNEELASTQRDAVIELASGLAPELGTGILLVSDRSDRSSTPDLPLEPPWATEITQVTGLPCWPDCSADSLFAQRCHVQMEEAIGDRVAELEGRLQAQRAEYVHARASRLTSWAAEIESWRPRPGTSLFRFWRKIADLPQVRSSPHTTRVVLLSDLEEAGTRERKLVQRLHRRFLARGVCPDESELPELEGVSIVLLQTVTDRIQAETWGARWETILTCAGADVTRHRYSPGIPLERYLDR